MHGIDIGGLPSTVGQAPVGDHLKAINPLPDSAAAARAMSNANHRSAKTRRCATTLRASALKA